MDKMERAAVQKKYRGVKIFLSVLGVLAALLLILYFAVTTNPQIAVGLIQKLIYGDTAFNSYKPFYESHN